MSQTGAPTLTAGTFAGCGSPVYSFTDSNGEFFFKRDPAPPLLPNKPPLEFVEAFGETLLLAESIFEGNVLKEGQERSPSFPTVNLETVGSFYETSYTGSPTPDASSSASVDYVVTSVNTPMGAIYTVHNADQSATLGMFSAAMTLGGTGACSTSAGMGNVMWDHNAGRWILMEAAGAPVNGTYYLCLYVSNTDNPLGMYTSFEISFGNIEPKMPTLGIWTRAYVLTINSTIENCCVIDREALLMEATFSGFCATPLSGLLSGFSSIQAWTPMTVEGNSPMPPLATENGNGQGIGAVFMRHHDDELHDGASTPFFDAIDVEHWSSINFTAQSYLALRYQVTVQDFDSSSGACPSPDACVPTPPGSTTFLNPNRETIMHRLAYRNRGPMKETAVVVFTSHANGVNATRIKWVQLLWQSPSLTFAPVWVNSQEGVIHKEDGLHRWNPSAATDENGTIALVYNVANATVQPSLAGTYRLASDPMSQFRGEFVSFNGSATSVVAPATSEWGRFASVSSWPGAARWFYVHAPYIPDDSGRWTSVSYRLRIKGETVERTFVGEDGCNQTTCVQTIVLE